MGKFWPILGLILLAFPFLEIATLLAAIRWFGFGPCFAWWLISVALGVLLLRTQGFAFKSQLFMTLGGQRNPLSAVFWMARRTIAALLLLLPGFLSDAIALLLLLPWPAPKLLPGRNSSSPSYSDSSRSGDFIDGEYRQVNDRKSSISQDPKQL